MSDQRLFWWFEGGVWIPDENHSNEYVAFGSVTACPGHEGGERAAYRYGTGDGVEDGERTIEGEIHLRRSRTFDATEDHPVLVESPEVRQFGFTDWVLVKGEPARVEDFLFLPGEVPLLVPEEEARNVAISDDRTPPAGFRLDRRASRKLHEPNEPTGEEMDRIWRERIETALSMLVSHNEFGECVTGPEAVRYLRAQLAGDDRGVRHTVQKDVRQFHQVIGVSEEGSPAIRRPELRAQLIMEEAIETASAILGTKVTFKIMDPEDHERVLLGGEEIMDEPDLVEAIDGICDILCVTYGSADEFGINVAPFWSEVHRTNLAKANGPVREDGKRLKPEGWTPPDIAGILENEKKTGE